MLKENEFRKMDCLHCMDITGGHIVDSYFESSLGHDSEKLVLLWKCDTCGSFHRQEYSKKGVGILNGKGAVIRKDLLKDV